MKNKSTIVTIRIIAALIVTLYIILATFKFNAPPESREMPNGIKPQHKEAFGGIISVYNINGFRPYSGSLAAILGKTAKAVEKKYFGVYFEVINMSAEQYEERLKAGEKPDIISFPCGVCYEEQFAVLREFELLDWAKGLGSAGGERYALAYAASGYVYAANSDRCDEKQFELKKEVSLADICVENEVAGNMTVAAANGVEMTLAPIEDFIAGKTMFAICDMAAIGDIIRLQANARGFDVKAYPLSGYTDEIQLIGISKNMAETKQKYAYAFIESLLSQESQQNLIKSGLFPAVNCAYLSENAPAPLKKIFAAEMKLRAPNAFLYRKHKQPLEAAAQRALQGDAAAKNDVRARLLELVED